jgi:hypothetical protein
LIFFPATGKHYNIAELHSNHFVAGKFHINIFTEVEGIHFSLNSLILHADHRHSLEIALQTMLPQQQHAL